MPAPLRPLLLALALLSLAARSADPGGADGGTAVLAPDGGTAVLAPDGGTAVLAPDGGPAGLDGGVRPGEGLAHAVAPPSAALTARVDAVFTRWDRSDAPGCAVGVAQGGQVVFERAYGMAELEHGVLNTPETVFEAGSVSKQFTAAAVLLLEQQGRVGLDLPVRTWLPELTGPSGSVTLRQMLHHTSGLRDWGALVAAAGWARGSRVHTQWHILELMRRQEALNYEPGTEYLYVNTGYNLAALVVERVTGQPLQDFFEASFFGPLGMTQTRWRTDHTVLVRGRATAYAPRGAGWALAMPFEDAVGQGGLLTTVGDLLRWNENFVHLQVGGPLWAEAMLRPGQLSSGRPLPYAAGLGLWRFRGVEEVGHTGFTAGYRAFLARYPAQHLSVALLCNAADANPELLGHAVAAIFLEGALAPEDGPVAEVWPATVLSPDVLAARAGVYLNSRTREPLRLVATTSGLEGEGVGTLRPVSGTVFQAQTARAVFELGRDGRPSGLKLETAEGEAAAYEPLPPPPLSTTLLATYAGLYRSREVESDYEVRVDAGRLLLTRRAALRTGLEPLGGDTFRAPGLGTLIFTRERNGRVSGLSLSMSRARDLRFRRVGR